MKTLASLLVMGLSVCAVSAGFSVGCMAGTRYAHGDNDRYRGVDDDDYDSDTTSGGRTAEALTKLCIKHGTCGCLERQGGLQCEEHARDVCGDSDGSFAKGFFDLSPDCEPEMASVARCLARNAQVSCSEWLIAFDGGSICRAEFDTAEECDRKTGRGRKSL